jgi:hypothetical protein
MKRERKIMERRVWDTILYEYVVPFRHVNEHLNPPTLIPHKDGEPLLNKRLTEYLRAVADVVPDMKVALYTHGLLLPKRPGFLDFLGSLPNQVQLLVSFHFYNHDGSVNDYTATTALLKAWLSRPKLGPENIEFVFASHLVAPMTKEKLLAWKETWRSFIDAGRVTVHANVSLNPWTGLIDTPNLAKFEDGCPYQHFDHMFFGATGNIVGCCMDLEEDIVFGNVMHDKPEDMLSTVRAFYVSQKMKILRYDVCRNCFGLPPKEKDGLLQLGVPA